MNPAPKLAADGDPRSARLESGSVGMDRECVVSQSGGDAPNDAISAPPRTTLTIRTHPPA